MKANAGHRRIVSILLAAALAAGLLATGTLYARGFWNEERAVHIKSADIESSTLAIGTHLIHLSALTDSLYEIAEQSAEDSGQDQIYYKSELGGDAWFEISSATSLADITTSGTPVTDEEIEALYFEYHTKSDKVTYDLRTGQAVNIFDIRDPYDLEALEELSPLKMQYDQIRESQGENDETKRIDEIWQLPVEESDAVQELDRQLDGLQAYLTVLKENDGGTEEIEAVSSVMEAVDAARRYEVFTALEPVLTDYIDVVSRGDTVTVPGDDGDLDIQSTNAELLSAATESLGNVQSALITYGGKMLEEGTTVMSRIRYRFSQALIDDAVGGTHADCDGDVRDLILLDHIQNDVIADRPRELALLEDTLLPEASSAYQQALGRGESAEYRAEQAKGSAQALLDRFIDENEGEVNSCRGELEFLIEAKCDRIDPASGMTFLDQRLETATGDFTSAIPSDAFEETSRASLDEHIAFLTRKRRELELAAGGNEMDALTAQKEDLQTQRLSALDKNDLAGAKALEEQIAALEDQIRSIEDETAAQIADARDKIRDLEAQAEADPGNSSLQDQLSAAKAELAGLESSLSDGSLGAMVAQLKKDALDGLDDGTAEGKTTAANAVDSMSSLLSTDPKLVLPAMQEVYNKLLLTDGDQGLIDTIEQAILDDPNALRDELSAAALKQIAADFLAGDGSGSGSGSGSSSGSGGSGTGNAGTGTGSGTGTENGTGLLGTGGISLAAAKAGATELVALQLYYDETGNRAALSRIGALAQQQQSLGNPLIFQQVEDGGNEYLPLPAVQVLTSWRYVWNRNTSLGVLARGGDYYGFTVYSAKVLRDRDGLKTEKMERSARYQGASVYIPEEYAYDAFGVQAVYLSGTSLACALDDAMLAQAQELFAQFLAG